MIWTLVQISDLHFCATPRRANLWKYVKRRIAAELMRAPRITPEVAPGIWLPDSHDPEIAEFVARKIYSLRNQIDLLLISGDIATTGLPEDLRIGVRYVGSQAIAQYFNADGGATLRSAVYPLMLMPGNHDRYRDNYGQAGSRTFDLEFGAYWGPDREIRTAILTRRTGKSLAVIAADFALRQDADATTPTRFMRYGQGFGYPDVVEKLTRKTTQLKERFQSIGIVWMIHFPPTSDGGAFGYRQLLNYEAVLEAARACNIKVILAGHIHEKKVVRLDDIDVVCAGSACIFAQGNGNWMHNLTIDAQDGIARLSTKVDYRWEDAAGEFVERF